MGTPTQMLREEHRELIPHVEQLCTAADRIGEASPEETRLAADEAYAFLVDHLIPHAQAEDAALYPLVARIMGAPEATSTMRRDHIEVVRLTEELDALRPRLSASDDESVRRDLRRVLYGLYAVVGLHFAKEEEVYLPLLDSNISVDEGNALVHAMEAAAGKARVQRANMGTQ